ncbi:MAG: aminoacyl-tRNA hydrolase [Ignavibacteria bacterium]|nr:aminoacyl-tRNA hydrolase [Ignavibacteria bacterium]
MVWNIFKKKEHYDWLIAGLGNPGRKYENTRHNIGRIVAKGFAEKYKAKINEKYTLFSHTAIEISGNKILIILPDTFMNLSGKALKFASDNFRVPPEKIICISDEFQFPLGKLHIKLGGGDGGHNGLTSIIEYLGTKDFYRLRCGIGRNFETGAMADYVLSDFTEEERKEKNVMIDRAIDGLECFFNQGAARALSQINSKES